MRRFYSFIITFCALLTANVLMPFRTAALTRADVPEIAGAVIYADSWHQNGNAFGVYSLPWAGSSTTKPIKVSDALSARYGGVYTDGKLLTIGEGLTYNVHDIETWELLSNKVDYYPEDLVISMADEPSSHDIYTCYYYSYEDEWGSFKEYYFGTFNLNDFTFTKIRVLDEDFFNAMAFSPDGTLFAVTDKGDFAKIDPLTGSYTKLGKTGLTPEGKTSAIIDPETRVMYYALSSDKKSALYALDTTTGEASFIYDMPDGEEVVALYFPKGAAPAAAPALPLNLSALFADGSLSGQITFIIPTQAYDGSELSGAISYSVKADDIEVATGTSQPGATVKTDVSVSESGMHHFNVILSNAAGDSPASELEVFIGHDAPVIPGTPTANYDGTRFTIKWDAAVGKNGGYVNAENVTYTVTRYPGEVLVADGIKGTQVEEEYAEPGQLEHVYFTVSATYGDHTSDPVASAEMVIGTLTPPYSENFQTKSGFEAFTIIDNNKDAAYGSGTWNWGKGYAQYVYIDQNPADDYLVLPGLKLIGGKSYTFSFKARCEDTTEPERVAVYVGSAPETGALTQEIVAPTTIDHTTYKTFEGVFVPATDGTYYFAVKACSDVNKYYLYVTDIQVSAPETAEVPAAVKSLALIPADFGELDATVSFVTPAVDIAGKDLKGLDKIEIFLNGQLYETLESPATGTTVTRTISVSKQGSYTVEVIPYNENGKGLSAEVSTYIGLGKPMAPESISAIQGDNEGQLIISWLPVQRDVNGTRMNTSQVTYTVYRSESGKTEVIANGLKVTSYIDQAVEEGSDVQKFVQYSVVAVNSVGESAPASTGLEIAGKSYILPYTESVSGGRLAHPFEISWETERDPEWDYGWQLANDETLRDTKSQDGDNGFLTFQGGKGVSGSITTGLISLKNSDHPVLTFYYNTYGGTENLNTIQVSISTGGDFTSLETLGMAGTEGWKKAEIDLNKYIGREVRIKFTALTNSHRTIMVDNISLRNLYDNDLTVASLTVPATVVTGHRTEITVKVRNIGTKVASGYSVELMRDKKIIGSQEGAELAPDSESSFIFNDVVPLFGETSVNYTASVVYTSDQNVKDNVSETVEVEVTSPAIPTPTDLHVVKTDEEGVTLAWTAPQLKDDKPEAVTDGAENYKSFSIGLSHSVLTDDNMGSWKMVDGDGKYTIGAKNSTNQMLNYPNARGKMSFQIFEPEALELTEASWAPHSGSKMWISFSAQGGANDDWMISPKLTGAKQTISFFARSAMSLYGLETFEFLISESGTSTEDFVLVKEVKEVPAIWEEYSYEIPEGTMYFAIRCTSDDKYALCIDDVTMVTEDSSAEKLELNGYNVYCNGLRLNEDTHEAETFIHTGADFETPLTYHVTAVYKSGESGLSNSVVHDLSNIDNIETSSISVYTEGSSIIVNAATAATPVAIYSVDGKALYAGYGNTRVFVTSGVYVVRAGSTSVKVAVR